ncbi:hypothetical protein CHS0354_024159 [Potamilus streckersoni]|uniref:Electron transfer flavoprotein alpha/beta-subunit N-terminal domain-containing protein n=1 Tax=Potamilus streckersoni TaxID=2493646 RepID=A0AAE0RZX2_9BIVA|nr:hypothetical protein CHS0354_024159 [Potamilus streckersoni]
MSFIVNPYDEWYALTKSLILKETLSEPVEIVLLCVGDANVEPLIRKALSIGGDRAIRVNAESHDSKFIAFQISEIAKAEKYNLIIGGKETISYNGGLVLSMVAEFMEAPFFNEITKLEFKDTAWIGQVNAEGGYQVLKAKPNTPVIASCAKGLAEQRFASLKEKKVRYSELEIVSVGSALAKQLNRTSIMVVFGEFSHELEFTRIGAQKIYHITNTQRYDNAFVSKVLNEIAITEEADICILPHNSFGKSVSGRLSVKLNAACVSGVTAFEEVSTQSSKLKKNVFSGKALAHVLVTTQKQVWTWVANSFPVSSDSSNQENTAQLIPYNVDFPTDIDILETNNNLTTTISLPSAEKVVSGGRGLGGPEHWEMIEELAMLLGAATACSRPVSDSGWRPHHEHVGQTGLTIRPNLYIAVAISGSTQHLAGVNGSKLIVVINSDPEAPFFHSADYGIVGDAFVIIPKLIELIRKHQS